MGVAAIEVPRGTRDTSGTARALLNKNNVQGAVRHER